MDGAGAQLGLDDMFVLHWILRFDLCQSFRSDGASYYGSNDATLVV